MQLALFMNRQSNGPPASQLDRDRRGHQINETTQYIPSTQKKQEVRFAEDSIVAQHVIYRGFDPDRASQLVLQDDAHSYNKYQKVKKYRRFTKLLYGNTEEASPHSTSHNSEFSKKDPSLHIPQTSKDVVEEAEEVHNLIVDALSPTSRRNVSAASHESGKDITGYIKDGRRIMPVINKKDENMSSQSRSSVFSPDKTYRHLPDQQYSGSPESDMNVKPVREVNDESPHTSDHPVVEVYRASKLPEMLSGCNPYFIFDWGEWGKAVTSSKFNVANPVYKESLLFDGDHDMYSAPSIDVYAFHKNVSISDEFIGKGHISEVNISNGVHIVHLFDAEGDQAGEVVVELVIPTIC